MSLVGINQGATVQLTETVKRSINTSTENTEVKSVSLSNDQVNLSVKKGIIPTFKGAGAGAIAGAVGAGAASAVALQLAGGANGWGGLVVMVAGIAGAAGGAVIGGTTANVTTNKWAAAGAGAVVGGLAAGIYSKDITGAIVGAVGGAVAGFAGAAVAQKK